jgi:hypothetical protein
MKREDVQVGAVRLAGAGASFVTERTCPVIGGHAVDAVTRCATDSIRDHHEWKFVSVRTGTDENTGNPGE